MSEASTTPPAGKKRRSFAEGHRARLAWLQQRVDRWWYLPLVSACAGLDTFVLAFPTDVFLVSSTALRPQRWLRIALFMALGSSLGLLAFAYAVESGAPWLHSWVGWAIPSASGSGENAALVARYSVFALFITAANPLVPPQPVVAVAVLAGMNPITVFVWILAGRVFKYAIYAFAAARAPRLVSRWMKQPAGLAAPTSASKAPVPHDADSKP
jgi:hypothetical protein